jgi:hypothetical protein
MLFELRKLENYFLELLINGMIFVSRKVAKAQRRRVLKMNINDFIFPLNQPASNIIRAGLMKPNSFLT